MKGDFGKASKFTAMGSLHAVVAQNFQRLYADPAVHDLLNICKRRQDFSVPEVGYEAMDENSVYAQIELAWEKEKLGVAIKLDDGVQRMIKQGWRIMTVPEAIQEWG